MRENPDRHKRHWLAACAAAAALASGGSAWGGPVEVPGWAEVSAIFQVRCIMCHSAQGAGLGLRLDTYEFALAGSTKGPVLLPGQAEDSEMIRRLRGTSTPRMPFLSRPLPDEELSVILRWIEGGLPESAE